MKKNTKCQSLAILIITLIAISMLSGCNCNQTIYIGPGEFSQTDGGQGKEVKAPDITPEAKPEPERCKLQMEFEPLAETTIKVGQRDAELARFRLSSACFTGSITSIKLTNAGTLRLLRLGDIRLYQGNTLISNLFPTPSNQVANFAIKNGLQLAGQPISLRVPADVLDGKEGQTVKLYLKNISDVTTSEKVEIINDMTEDKAQTVTIKGCVDITRNRLVELLYDYLGLTDCNVANPPTQTTCVDIPAGQLSCKWAALEKAKILQPYSNGQCGGGDPINRAAIAKFIIQLMGFVNTNLPTPPPNFVDTPSDTWYYHYLRLLNALELTFAQGSYFRPADSASACWVREVMGKAKTLSIMVVKQSGGIGTIEFTDSTGMKFPPINDQDYLSKQVTPGNYSAIITPPTGMMIDQITDAEGNVLVNPYKQNVRLGFVTEWHVHYKKSNPQPPTITVLTPPTSAMPNANADLIKLRMCSPGSNNNSLARFTLELATKGFGVVGKDVYNFQARKANGSITDANIYTRLNNHINRLNNTQAGSGLAASDNNSMNGIADGTLQLVVSFDREQIVASGSCEEFSVLASIAGAVSNDVLEIRIADDNSAPKASGRIYGTMGSYLFQLSDDFRYPKGNRAIVYSDWSSITPHLYPTIQRGIVIKDTGTDDFHNGFGLKSDTGIDLSQQRSWKYTK